METDFIKLNQIIDNGRESFQRRRGVKGKKQLESFWNDCSREISEKLWLPSVRKETKKPGSEQNLRTIPYEIHGVTRKQKTAFAKPVQKLSSLDSGQQIYKVLSSPPPQPNPPPRKRRRGKKKILEKDESLAEEPKKILLCKTKHMRISPFCQAFAARKKGGKKNIDSSSLLSENNQIQFDIRYFRWYCNFVRDILMRTFTDYHKEVDDLDWELIPEKEKLEEVQKSRTDEIANLKKKLVDDIKDAGCSSRSKQCKDLREKYQDDLCKIREKFSSSISDLYKRIRLFKATSNDYLLRIHEIRKRSLFCEMTSGRDGKHLDPERVRKIIMNHITVTGVSENKVCEIHYDPSVETEVYKPPWVFESSNVVYKRTIRGAICMTATAFRAAMTNFRAGRISHFDFSRHLSKKHFNMLYLEDAGLPTYLKTIIQRKKPDFDFTKGCTIKYFPKTKKYTVFYPVEIKELKEKKKSHGVVDLKNDVVSAIDEGIVNTHTVFTHDKNNKDRVEIFACSKSVKIKRYLARSDMLRSKLEAFKGCKRKYEGIKRHILIANAKIHNCIEDMNKKLASRLAKENDHIFLPEFRVAEIAKRSNLQSSQKRLLYCWQFHPFRAFLKYKCTVEGTNFYEGLTEEFTSKTCGKCGSLKGSYPNYRVHHCDECGEDIDRDVNGARNILIKCLSS